MNVSLAFVLCVFEFVCDRGCGCTWLRVQSSPPRRSGQQVFLRPPKRAGFMSPPQVSGLVAMGTHQQKEACVWGAGDEEEQ